MDWTAYYQQHQITADEAVAKIRSGNRIVIGHACGEPAHLVRAMVRHAAEREGVGGVRGGGRFI